MNIFTLPMFLLTVAATKNSNETKIELTPEIGFKINNAIDFKAKVETSTDYGSLSSQSSFSDIIDSSEFKGKVSLAGKVDKRVKMTGHVELEKKDGSGAFNGLGLGVNYDFVGIQNKRSTVVFKVKGGATKRFYSNPLKRAGISHSSSAWTKLDQKYRDSLYLSQDELTGLGTIKGQISVKTPFKSGQIVVKPEIGVKSGLVYYDQDNISSYIDGFANAKFNVAEGVFIKTKFSAKKDIILHDDFSDKLQFYSPEFAAMSEDFRMKYKADIGSTFDVSKGLEFTFGAKGEIAQKFKASNKNFKTMKILPIYQSKAISYGNITSSLNINDIALTVSFDTELGYKFASLADITSTASKSYTYKDANKIYKDKYTNLGMFKTKPYFSFGASVTAEF